MWSWRTAPDRALSGWRRSLRRWTACGCVPCGWRSEPASRPRSAAGNAARSDDVHAAPRYWTCRSWTAAEEGHRAGHRSDALLPCSQHQILTQQQQTLYDTFSPHNPGWVWYGMVRYGTVRYGMVWYGILSLTSRAGRAHSRHYQKDTSAPSVFTNIQTTHN